MKIAILGTGNVGGALARLWSQHKHEVLLSPSSKEKEHALRKAFPQCRVGATSELTQAEVFAVCLPWQAVEPVLKTAGDLDRKVLIDCTNPLAADLSRLLFGGTTSAAEQIQGLYPAARVVKAFNSLGAPLLGNGQFSEQLADGFYCGDDVEAKQTAASLIADAGLNPVDVGPLRNARYLESLAMLWIDMAVHQKRGANFTFKLISR